MEILALRHQLVVLQRTNKKRLRLRTSDRILWIVLSRFRPQWRECLLLVKPDTVIAWHRQLVARKWDYSQQWQRVGRPPLSKESIYLLIDRDDKFSEAFRVTLEGGGVKPVRLPPRSPNLNFHIQRFMRSIKEECLERMIFFGERAVQTAVVSFLSHYRQERNHQGLDNKLIERGEEVGRTAGEVVCRDRLGGILRYYYRKAA